MRSTGTSVSKQFFVLGGKLLQNCFKCIHTDAMVTPNHTGLSTVVEDFRLKDEERESEDKDKYLVSEDKASVRLPEWSLKITDKNGSPKAGLRASK